MLNPINLVSTNLVQSIVVVVITLALGACVVSPTLSQKSLATIKHADQLVRDGNPIQAAELYWQAAQSLSSPESEKLQLRAVETVLTPTTLNLAQKYQSRLEDDRFHTELFVKKRILDARIALLAHQPQSALTALSPVEVRLNPKRAIEMLQLRAQALRLLNQILASVTLRVRVDSQLTDLRIQQDNHWAIWDTLKQANIDQLQQWVEQSSDPKLKGWLTLAELSKSTPSQREALFQQLNSWRQRNPGHPADAMATTWILEDWQALQFKPQRIAIILSLSGQYSTIANAILAGIITAYYTNTTAGGKPTLQIYDLDDKPNNAQAVYTRAVEEKADIIIGPLDKQAVTALSLLAELPVPLLSLNYIDNRSAPLPKNFYQFGLSPEQEAIQVADRALADGKQNAIAFVPVGAWGDRLLKAFTVRLEASGGRVLSAQHLKPRITDFSAPIKQALLLYQSEQRYRNLMRLLGREVKFEPSRRPDADMVFAAIPPQEARLLRPQLNFHFASDLPVYATSHIYSGEENPAVNGDLNGVIYCDMPWILDTKNPQANMRKKIDALFPSASKQLPRFTALGVDAYQLIPYIKRLASIPNEHYPGETGDLSMNGARQIFRELKWARFVRGRPNG